MKLYHAPSTCSLASYIALLEAGLTFEPVRVDTKTHKLQDGTDYYTINPLGYVPLLELDDGMRLHEGAAILQYIADQAPAQNLAPANGKFKRYRLQEWLSFISTELHKNFSPLFYPGVPEAMKPIARATLRKRLEWVDGELAGSDYLLGEQFSVADAYLFTVLGWCKFAEVNIADLAHISAFVHRVAERPAVQKALKAERADG